MIGGSLVICRSQPVASPDLKCLAVNAPSGNVTLSWVIPPDPGSQFVAYHIFSSLSLPGPFAQIATITPYSQNFYNDPIANANSNPVYYYIITESLGSIFSVPKDTLSTIYLNVTNFSIDIANLNWNELATPNISSSLKWYRVYRKYPAGAWILRDSTQNLFYKDTLRVLCAYSYVNYKVEISDSVGCTSTSNIDSSQFQDQTPPTLVPIDTVSVDFSSSKATISWYQSPSPDAESVVIYKGTWSPIDTVPVLPAFYTYTASVAGTVSEYYRVAFLDSCGNISPMGIEHQTIYLSATFDICATTASLVWNQYINMIPAVNQYQIFRSVNGPPFTLLATNSASDTDYMDTGLALGNSYCYFIRATNNGSPAKTSTSNKACFNATVLSPPTYHYNRYATVVSDKQIDIKAHVDPTATSVKKYNIQRAINGSGSFTTIATPAPAGTVLMYTDNGVNTGANSYIYKVDAMDSCAHVITSSNIDTTMLLTASVAPNLDVTLSWNDYGSFLGGVDHYDIYRSVDGVWNTSPIGTVTPTGSGETFTDDVSPFFTSKGIFSYKVVAIEGAGNPFFFADSSTSNIAKVYEYPKIYVPNAFTPNGDNMNDIFIPVIGFIEPAEYSLRIFDNTGTPVMITNNPAEGWDGKKKGHPCQEGVYMYLIQCKASNGDDSKISGTVSLFK
ncbi:MAG: gliding motility-associated C-terminal domain-containing protein [Bacteroidetes bacterium]|nr:gliding motility-associated C-terminal domain-containing protein [Bacteroidota bacterium]